MAFNTSNSKLFLDTVNSAINDGFMIASVQAKRAREICVMLSEWMKLEENAANVNSFAERLISVLEGCLPAVGTKKQREKMWRAFHETRLSDEFKQLWFEFVINAIQIEPPNLFFQHITDLLFQVLITTRASILKTSVDVSAELSYDEANALRYVAGYVCSKVRTKIMASRHSHRDQMLLCLVDMCDKEDEPHVTSNWINAIDRGGLCHVSDASYSFFHEMELFLRKTYCIGNEETVEEGNKVELVRNIIDNEDIQFQWCMITTEVEDEEAKSLLKMIIDLYITIRGYSFVKSVMELYKQNNDKRLQKSKSLRKKIQA